MGIGFFGVFSVTHKIGLFSPKIKATPRPWRTSSCQKIRQPTHCACKSRIRRTREGTRKLGGGTAAAAASAAVAAAQSMAAVHSATEAALLQQHGCCGGGGSATARHWQQLGSGAAVAAASAAVVAAGSAAAAHSATAAARWQQQGGCGGFTGTVCECADACAFERHRRANVFVFVLGQGWRDDSADGIVVVSSNGGARGNVHRGRQCVAAAAKDATADNTADANGDVDNIVC